MRAIRILTIAAGVLGGLMSAAKPAHADVKMPALFGDHMVLQREAALPVWGWADPGEKVTVSIGAENAAVAEVSTVAAADGAWQVRLPAMPLGPQGAKPLTLRVFGKNTITFNDVLIGDVWVCSGQSNMAFPLRRADDATAAIADANVPSIRMFVVNRKITLQRQGDCLGKWVVCSPETAADFSAVGYFFAKQIHQSVGVPLGLIGAYFNGSPAEAWVSLGGLRAEPALAKLVDVHDTTVEIWRQYEQQAMPAWRRAQEHWERQVGAAHQQALKRWEQSNREAKAAGAAAPAKPLLPVPAPVKPKTPELSFYIPSVLHNGMIAPIVPYAIRGVIWYQGESNAGNAGQYRTLFPALIADWRRAWGQGDFPFLYVQLANFQARKPEPGESGWASLREAQSNTLAVPNTAQAVSIDLGEAADIHPKNKRDVGNRLSLAARHLVYGQDVVCSGPVYERMQVEGGGIRLWFRHIGGGLTMAAAPTTQRSGEPARADDAIKGFAIAGADRKYVWAKARIEGDTIVVWNDQVLRPVSVRYGWADNPDVNLYNKEGLPMTPFRTDGPPVRSPGR